MLDEFQSATSAMAGGGVLLDSSPLQPPQTATTVRVRKGEMQRRYYILDCNDLDTALRYAAMIPRPNTGRSRSSR